MKSFAVALFVLLAAAPAAQAAVTAKASLVPSGEDFVLQVKVKSDKRFTARTRPRKVRVTAGEETYKLDKAKQKPKVSEWRSESIVADAAQVLVDMVGQDVEVRVKNHKGTRTLEPPLAGPPAEEPPPDGGAPGPQPLFDPAPGELEGEAAFNHFKRYFLDSRFTDCPGVGWPACAVEERYMHCADFSWEYHRYTPTSGSDINTYSTITVTGAAAHPDGSWGVEYVDDTYGGFYTWNVAADGTVTGGYRSAGGDVQQLGPLRWQQPAGCGS